MSKQSSSWKRYALGAALLLLLAGLVGWHAWPRVEANPEVARAQAMVRELVQQPLETMAPEERQEKVAAMNQAAEALRPEQRGEMFKAMHKQHLAEAEAYSALPESERTPWLDQRIDRMEAIRKTMQALGVGPFGLRPPGASAGNGRGNEERPAGPPPEMLEKMHQEILNGTTPAQRDQLARLMQDMSNRRQERGLPPMPMPPGSQ